MSLDERGRAWNGLLDGGACIDEQVHVGKFQPGCLQDTAHRRRTHRGVRVPTRLDEMPTADARFLLYPTRRQFEALVQFGSRDDTGRQVDGGLSESQ